MKKETCDAYAAAAAAAAAEAGPVVVTTRDANTRHGARYFIILLPLRVRHVHPFGSVPAGKEAAPAAS